MDIAVSNLVEIYIWGTQHQRRAYSTTGGPFFRGKRPRLPGRWPPDRAGSRADRGGCGVIR